MDISYLKAIDRIKFAAADIQKLLEAAPVKTFEDKQAYCIFESLLADLQSAISMAERFAKPAVEGILQEMDNGKFELISNNGKSICRFSSGSPLEVFSQAECEWHSGRVEHKNGYYYFYCTDLGHPALFTGMKARIRQMSYLV